MVQVGVNKYSFLWFFFIVLFSCKNESSNQFENKKEYNLKVGETFKIYFKINSSLQYCIPNIREVNNIKLISEKSLRLAPQECDGCDEVYELEFLAKRKGSDTLKHTILPALKNCDNKIGSNDLNKIVIKVQ